MIASLQPVASLLLGAALLLIGNGLQFTLLPLRADVENFGALVLGLIASAYYVGFVAGCLMAPRLIRSVGHIRAFTAAVAVLAALALAYALVAAPMAWTLFRLLAGFCIAGFYLVLESWLNDGAADATRGRVMSTYVIISLAALMVGQTLVPLYPVAHSGSFMLSAILTALAIVPVALTRSAQPAPIGVIRLQPMRLYRTAPVALIASGMIGLANGAFWGLGALAVAGMGHGVEDVAWFMGAAVLGGAAMQWPLGRLSDRYDRRLVLLPTLIGAAAVGIALWSASYSVLVLLLLGSLFGALCFPGYALAAAHGYDKVAADDLVATGATILLANGIGSAIGPLLASALMTGLGPRGLFLFTALAQILLAAFVLYRTRVQPSLPPQAKTEFDLATTAPAGAAIGYELIEVAAGTDSRAMNERDDTVPASVGIEHSICA